MVFVTGGSGLVGRELIAQLLEQGKKVFAIYNKTPLPDFQSANLHQIKCSILDIAELENILQTNKDIEQIYHCAAIVTFNPRLKRELFKVNIEGTANIVNAAINSGIKKIVHVSSVASLGRMREDVAIDETMNWTEETNNSHYGQSKYLGEMEVWRGIGEGLDAVIVNPTIILGAGDWNAGSPHLFKSIYNEFPWYSDGTTGFVDVRDVAAAMIQLMDSDISGQRFIINAENKSFKELFDLIAKTFGKKTPYKKVTPFLAKVVWRLEAIKSIFTGKTPLITKETSVAAMAKVNFDNSKLKKQLPGFTYRKIEDTIAHTCAAFINGLSKK
ncbi:NAD-dependent epimerase/dehydratase family protein [Ferruginibacter lapsinanis]|uniref:NAD-dependent epimerase/dehydratase family protein n=1 Tax=Ferruginibacter lapsinanis TaxID=563172 RepID=UPI001E53764F|nr:NAD-dependent epimerase/dehydratase family protein [Ferruginibacter lapsinanis]UEG51030.1 NAD-dependent epimerase/dehydratase family protein [Ferruginibacter lapsinanis]